MTASPSVESLRLRALALELLPRIAKPGSSVAITGSVARGTATKGSGLDVWVLGMGRSEVLRVGVTTIFVRRQTLAEARTFENLLSAEVDSLLLLDDRTGQFEQVRRAWNKHRRRARAEGVRRLQKEANTSAQGSEAQRVLSLRRACWALVQLRVLIDHGWRPTHPGAAVSVVSKETMKRLDEVLAIPAEKNVRAALKAMRATAGEVKKLTGVKLALEVDVWSAQPARQAAFVAREALQRKVLPVLFAPWAIGDVRGLELISKRVPKTALAVALLQQPIQKRHVERLERHLSALQLELAR